VKTKVVITDTVGFTLGMLLFVIAFAELFLFCVTSDLDKISILFFALSLGLRHIQDSTTKINIKEENNNGKREDE